MDLSRAGRGVYPSRNLTLQPLSLHYVLLLVASSFCAWLARLGTSGGTRTWFRRLDMSLYLCIIEIIKWWNDDVYYCRNQ
jgi:hypothetical protein